MPAETFTVDVAESRTTARHYAARDGRTVLVLAHGAGAPQTHPWMVGMAQALAARGLDVVTFNFLYSEARRRVPDKTAVLEETWRAVLDAVRAREDLARARVFIGGKSMGGRIATHLAAQAVAHVEGLVLLGYPLHPPGKPDKLRALHLAQITLPMLIVQGSRDTFGTPDELAPFVAPLARHGTRLFAVQGGDHSLTPLKSGPLNREQVMALVSDEIVRFTA